MAGSIPADGGEASGVEKAGATRGTTMRRGGEYGEPWSSPLMPSWPLASPRRAELATAFAVLVGLAAIALGGHVLHGGYHLDDWLALQLSHHLGGGNAWSGVERQWHYSGFRPVSSIYRAIVWDSPLGTHMRANLAAAALAAVVMCLLLFAVLRDLRFSRTDAGAIASLVLVSPLASSTRLWISASTASINIAIYLIGLLLALRGMRAESTRAQVAWHTAAATAYLASVLFAETTAAIVVATGLLYWALRGVWAAVARTLVDTTLAVAGVAWISTHNTLTPRSAASVGALWSRIISMAHDVPTVFERTVDPFRGRGLLAVLALVILVGGTATLRLLPRGSAERYEISRWLVTALAGLVVVLAGWVIYLPADNYYRPAQAGIGNRINALASVGLVLVVYAVVRIAGALVAMRGGRAPTVATALTGLLTVALLVGYIRDTRADATIWNRAFASEGATLAFVRTSVPHPPPDSTIYVVRQPQYDTPEVPIFVAWDFRPALRFAYDGAPILAAWAVPWSVPFHCQSGAVYPLQWGWSRTQGARYGNVWMLDVATRAVWRIADRASCLEATAAVAALPPARWVL